MPFDWEGFLRRHRVDYVTRGPNVGPGEVNVRCPLCGDADPSHHMGISLSGRGWSCLRSRAHSGKSRARLIQLILRCSEDDARRLAGYDTAPPRTEDDLRKVLDKLENKSQDLDSGPLTMPNEFKPLLKGGVLSRPFVEYVRGRGYQGAELEWVAREYNLHYATSGPFAYRLIIPVRDRHGALLTWTGRAVSQSVEPRYKTLSTDPEFAPNGRPARLPTSRTLLGLGLLHQAAAPAALVVCEGPMDAIRLTCFGRHLGVYATCLFGLNASEEQAAELEILRGKFPAVFLCIDAGEELRRTQLLGALSSVGARALPLPTGVKDPGDLSPDQTILLATSVLSLATDDGLC